MNIQIGKIIRDLRRRDNRTQEMLAEAVGVTAQAVSRWESGGSYPDMELIPAVANYFHVSIDELFGYHGDREARIKDILARADEMMRGMAELEACVGLLRQAAAEFPSEAIVRYKLGCAVMLLGWQGHGARRSVPDKDGDAVNDVEYNRENLHFEEALRIFENVLPQLEDPDARFAVIGYMTRLYSLRGEYDKVAALAMERDPLAISCECLLTQSAVGEKRAVYQAEALLALAKQVKKTVVEAVLQRADLRHSAVGVDKLLCAAALYEGLLDDGRCGYGHFDLYELYLWCAVITAELGDIEKAVEYFGASYDHGCKYSRLIDAGGEYRYTAPLVSGAVFVTDGVQRVANWSERVKRLPCDLRKALENDRRFAECF